VSNPKRTEKQKRTHAEEPELRAAPIVVPLEWDTPMYRLAVDQLDQTAEQMNLDPNIWERLRAPQRSHVVSFPFRRDDYHTVETVFAYRSVDQLAKEKKVTLRTAALMRGIGRVSQAKLVRGVFP